MVNKKRMLLFITKNKWISNRCTRRMLSQVVVISGASSGIGEEIAFKYSKKNARLVLSARRKERLESVANRCRELGSESVEIVTCDVSKEEDCKSMIRRAVEVFGSIDILVLNAGVGQVNRCFAFLASKVSRSHFS